MKQIKIVLLFAVMTAVFMPGVYAVHTPVTPELKLLSQPVHSLYGVPFHTSNTFTVGDVIRMSPNEFSKNYGFSMSLKQKMAYRFARLDYKYKLSHGDYEANNMPHSAGGFSFLAFILGFFLSLLGVLISWILWGRKGLVSSLYGFLFSFILVVLGLLR